MQRQEENSSSGPKVGTLTAVFIWRETRPDEDPAGTGGNGFLGLGDFPVAETRGGETIFHTTDLDKYSLLTFPGLPHR